MKVGLTLLSVKADFPKKHFWTLSIWKDQDSLKGFITEEPHATAVKKIKKWAGEGSAFVEWTYNWLDWGYEKTSNPTFTTRKNEIEEKTKIEVDLNAARLVIKPTAVKSAAGDVRHDSIEDRWRCVRRLYSYSANKSLP